MKTGFANLVGKNGIVASVSFDQPIKQARVEFERAYLRYHLGTGPGRCDHLRSVGDVSYFYSRCRKWGVALSAAE
jgi:hypothetical protein